MRFYIYINEKVMGPYDPEDITKQFGGLSPDTQVCVEKTHDGDSEKWRIISLVPELAHCIKREISEPISGIQPAPGHRLSLQILSTDDDSNIRELLWNMLEEVGHRVEFARDGEEVFKRLAEKRYDLVILDVNMPKMNGYKVSELIHKKLSNPPKIIIFTGRDLQKERLQFVCSGADSILSKGVDNDKLIRTIDGLFSRKSVRTVRPPAAAFMPEPTPPALSAPAASAQESAKKKNEETAPGENKSLFSPPPPVPGLMPLQKESFFEAPCQEKTEPPAKAAPPPESEAVTIAAAPVDAFPPAGKTAEAQLSVPASAAEAPLRGGPDIVSDQPAIKTRVPVADSEDIARLLGHMDLECARLEMQFEKRAVTMLETHQEAVRKLQAEWLKMRRYMVLTALSMAASVLAALLIVILRG